MQRTGKASRLTCAASVQARWHETCGKRKRPGISISALLWLPAARRCLPSSPHGNLLLDGCSIMTQHVIEGWLHTGCVAGCTHPPWKHLMLPLPPPIQKATSSRLSLLILPQRLCLRNLHAASQLHHVMFFVTASELHSEQQCQTRKHILYHYPQTLPTSTRSLCPVISPCTCGTGPCPKSWRATSPWPLLFRLSSPASQYNLASHLQRKSRLHEPTLSCVITAADLSHSCKQPCHHW